MLKIASKKYEKAKYSDPQLPYDKKYEKIQFNFTIK